ncbi:hypothetical protein OE699_01930 [Sedimentimonas flavescens]|uniref:Myb-like domain-containing protein n=1 Tax=Sedimentimonas flavescens TaxID=2851012 RepID=A0ABT2ZV20_9RHOB|nr:hypothetical protein [Sedimentimonas flavescens]MCV2877598.1 hypothetical protein [Sedimentimonas flavescens]
MAGEISEPVPFKNLFGEDWGPFGKGKGRPPFEWTSENSNKVSMLLAAGWSNERIAGVVLDPRTGKSISVPTLKRHFRAELAIRDAARDRLEAERLMRVWGQAQSGNVGAERVFMQLLDKNDRMESERSFAARTKEPTGPKVGKKIINEQRALEADDDLMQELERESGHARPN